MIDPTNNLQFNSGKFQYKLEKVKYLGQIFSIEGMKPDPNRVSAINNLEIPKDKKGLQSILGMINFMRIYIPHLPEICKNMYGLLKNDKIFQWLPIHTEEFNNIKKVISNAPTLKNFDEKLETIIQCDSSKHGLGACLMQAHGPICFASRSLSSSELNFATIEKEMLAITFAVSKFHYYIYGRKVTVHSDHKPIISIMNKDLSKVYATRLQRMRLKLLKYNIEVTYVPGKFLHMADLLSRNVDKTALIEDTSAFSEVVHSVNISENRKISMIYETEKDPILGQIINFCKNGWPKHITKIREELRYYYKLKNDIFYEDGLLFYEDRIIIPYSMQNEALKLLHQAHLGLKKTKDRAKELLFWPLMNKEIENIIQKCLTCQKFMRKNRKEEIIFHDIPNQRFMKLGMDIMEYSKSIYLVIADYFSKWLEVVEIKNKTIDEVIKTLKPIFATHGIPKEIVCDNNPFNSYKFKEFVKFLNCNVNFTSPYYAQSNGFAEKNVDIAKMLVKKSIDSKQELFLALLEYRNTPIQSLAASPSQILFSRRCRTLLPMHDRKLEPKIIENIPQKIKLYQEKVRSQYNKTTQNRPNFHLGDNVYFQKPNNLWYPGVIIDQLDVPRSYVVEGEGGVKYRKNKSFINRRSTSSDVTPENNIEIIDTNESGIYSNLNSDGQAAKNEQFGNYITKSGRHVKPVGRYQSK